ncbi:WD40-repeat-containing domain protein [Schizophyllum commune]
MAEYAQVAILGGQQDAVLSLSFSVCGRFLAATGYTGVCVWDVIDYQDVPIPSLPAALSDRYVYTKSTWLQFEDSSVPIFVLGSMRGEVTLWRWVGNRRAFSYSTRSKSSTSTEAVSVDVLRPNVPRGEQGRIALATADGHVTVWSVDAAASELRQLFVITLKSPFVLKTVKFDLPSRAILAFSGTGGIVSRFNCDTGECEGSRQDAPNLMASVVLDPAKSIYAAYTGTSIEIHSLKRKKNCVLSIKSEPPSIYYPMYMALGEGGEVLLAGTDKGCALLYDVVDGKVLQSLEYPKGGLVQQVATCGAAGPHLLAIAGSSIRRSADVILFRKSREPPPAPQRAPVIAPKGDIPGKTTACECLAWTTIWMVMLALLAVLYISTLEHKLKATAH